MNTFILLCRFYKDNDIQLSFDEIEYALNIALYDPRINSLGTYLEYLIDDIIQDKKLNPTFEYNEMIIRCETAMCHILNGNVSDVKNI